MAATRGMLSTCVRQCGTRPEATNEGPGSAGPIANAMSKRVIPVSPHTVPLMEVRMTRRSTLLTGLALALLVPLACTNDRRNPAAPNTGDPPSFNRAHEDDEDDHDGLGFQRLVAIAGPGSGRIRATRIPHPATPGNFAVRIEARVRGAKANTTYLVQRAPEAFAPPGPPAGFDIATSTDGSCQRGLAIAPWSTMVPTPAAFLSFPNQGTGSPTITTNQSGKGEADFIFALAFPLPEFDVMFRLLEVGAAPTSVLQSDCITLPL